MATAFWAMCVRDKGGRHKANSRSFEAARVASAEHSRNIQLGVPKSEAHKASMRVPKVRWTAKRKADKSANMKAKYKLKRMMNND